VTAEGVVEVWWPVWIRNQYFHSSATPPPVTPCNPPNLCPYVSITVSNVPTGALANVLYFFLLIFLVGHISVGITCTVYLQKGNPEIDPWRKPATSFRKHI